MSKLSLITVCLAVSAMAQAEQYQPSPIVGWQEIVFSGHTRYQQQNDCVSATAQSSASGLIRQVDQSLLDKPVLRWQWRAEQLLTQGKPAPEKLKAGDDFIARVYVIREGLFPWQTKAINYVWSREHAVGSHWPNPFTSNAMMVVVQSGSEGVGQWQSFERNVRADFQKFFSVNIDMVNAVAVMTDTDNSMGRAEACYQLPVFSPASTALSP